MKINNKGFTFVEILAVIAIIGILTGISIAAFSRNKENAIKSDYEALARSSYNAMEEYMMSHQYDDTVSLETLENENLLSNRKDPGDKDKNCTGTVEVSKNSGSNGKLDDGTYKVNLCCSSYKKTYTYPEGKVEDLTDESLCNTSESETPEPTPPPTPNNTKIKCAAGKYLPKNKTTCANCTSGNYCLGGEWYKSTTKDQGLSPCPNGYKNSEVGSKKQTDCYMNVPAKKYVKKKKDTSPSTCGKGTYKGAHKVYYNSTSSCNNCPSGYRDGAVTTSQSNCIMNVPKKKYVKKSKDSKPTDCPTGRRKDAHTVKYGNISSCESKQLTVTFDCNGGTRSSGPASATYQSDKTGQKFTTKCTKTGHTQDGWKRDRKASNSNYSTGSSVSENFVLTYTPKITIHAHWKLNSYKCSAGKYLKKSDTKCTECLPNNYCPGGEYKYDTTKDQGIFKCSEKAPGYPYSKEGSSKDSNCYMKVAKNNYVSPAKAKNSRHCDTGLYKEAHNVYYGKVSSCSNESITVTFNCNGGTRSSGPASSVYYTNKTGQKFTTNCTKPGYKLEGWKRDKNASTINYSTESSVSENFILTYKKSITLYAHWKPNVCTVTYKPGKGKIPSSNDKDYDDGILEKANGEFNKNASDKVQTVNYDSYFGSAENGMRDAKGGHYDAVLAYHHIDSSKAWTDGTRTFNEGKRYLAQTICKNLDTRDDSVTLTVNWQKNEISIIYDTNGLKLAPSPEQSCPETIKSACKGICKRTTDEDGCTKKRTGIVKKGPSKPFDTKRWATEGVKDNADSEDGKLFMTKTGKVDGTTGPGEWTTKNNNKTVTFDEDTLFKRGYLLADTVNMKNDLKKGNIEFTLKAVKP